MEDASTSRTDAAAPESRREMMEAAKDGSAHKLYDRDEQTSMLFDAYQRCCVSEETSHEREIVVVSGPSGAGKTALALQLKGRVKQIGGYFVSGKFDQLAATYQATSKAYYEPFVDACTELCHQVVANGPETVRSVKVAVQHVLNAVEISVLQDSIPALRSILGSSHVATRKSSVGLARGLDAEGRFARILCRFLLCVCTGNKSPLVMFLDDLQWANNKALELLKTLATAEKGLMGSKFMILCTYRIDDVSPNDILPICIGEIAGGGVVVTNITVSGMNERAVCKMIADILNLPADKCKKLADAFYLKTSGNVFFIKQLLRFVSEDRKLRADETGEVQWDESDILQTTDIHSVLELLTKKVEQLPEKAKEVLKVASCLGLAFEESVLWAAGTADKAEVSNALRLADKRGLMIVSDEFSKGRFVHDKVQQAAYSLIPVHERSAFHLNIGRKIFPIVPPKLEDPHLLLLADQIARGVHLVKDPDEKLVFVELFLRAGEKAAMSSAYANAAEFLTIGISLLDEAGWEKKYNLALTLYNTTIEVECYNGNFDRVDALVAVVFKRARMFEDTLKAHFTRIYSRCDIHACVTEALALWKFWTKSFLAK